MVIHQFKSLLLMQALYNGVQILAVPFPVQLPDIVPGKAAQDGTPDFSWPRLDHCGHFRSEQENGRFLSF